MIRNLLIAIALILMLVSCGSVQPRRVKVETVEVKVPVKVPCIDKAPERPTYQYGVGVWPGTQTAIAQLIADLEAAKNYGQQWEAAATGCERSSANWTMIDDPDKPA